MGLLKERLMHKLGMTTKASNTSRTGVPQGSRRERDWHTALDACRNTTNDTEPDDGWEGCLD
jgi:hypothetical protein